MKYVLAGAETNTFRYGNLINKFKLKMKIIQLIQKPQRRGAEIFAAQLSEQLRLAGNEVLLVSIFEGESELPFKGEFLKMNRPISNRFFDFKGWRDFAKIVQEFKPDIIQANAADTLKFSVFSKRLFGWKSPIIYRNANQMGDFIRNRFHQRFNQFLINQVSGVVSVSKASRIDFHYTFIFPERKSVTIPIGIDTNTIDGDLKENLGVTIPEEFLLQIGGLVEEKDPRGMLQIYIQLLKKYPELHLVFIGSGSLQAALKQEIEDNGLKDIVRLIANKPNIFPILSKTKALVMPSKIEGLPGVILEAMYCKVPVIAYGVGGIPEVVISNKTGFCVEVADQEAFQKAIEEVLNLPEDDLEEITTTARELVLKDYQIDQIAKEFDEFYCSIIANAQTKNN
ncbi:glycosyltransferase family 4 protein [Algoriphagus persicinus]|uniref:glycosyltransferase family 4 protein n=1 Tax=Algoriphagus persicinus TaxID=3108754 RepID=UPI002B394279|nr:glycosyltransferase family 4 protein [Algoriphagus sp. E1-3-M2]MEB2784726.1 glycosyltransferase family 4 protein [Algoriphagus sp. E1-3-M2]